MTKTVTALNLSFICHLDDPLGGGEISGKGKIKNNKINVYYFYLPYFFIFV